jgi:predicted HTH domain antitoxin
MERLIIDIPDDLKGEVEPYRDRLREALFLGLREMRVQQVLHLYREGVVSFARAAALAGVSRQDLSRHARAAGIQPRWSQEMAAEELA